MPKFQIMTIFARLKTIDLDISSFFLGSSCAFSTENDFCNKGLRIIAIGLLQYLSFTVI